jgi:hypothetical protein
LTCASIFDGSRRDFRLALLLLPHINCWTRVASEMNALSPAVREVRAPTDRPSKLRRHGPQENVDDSVAFFFSPVQTAGEKRIVAMATVAGTKCEMSTDVNRGGAVCQFY